VGSVYSVYKRDKGMIYILGWMKWNGVRFCHDTQSCAQFKNM
jgi:hypothetical protein